MKKLNPYILTAMRWLDDKNSVSRDELVENRKAAYDTTATTDVDYIAAATAAYAAAASNWVAKYFEQTGENREDYNKVIRSKK